MVPRAQGIINNWIRAYCGGSVIKGFPTLPLQQQILAACSCCYMDNIFQRRHKHPILLTGADEIGINDLVIGLLHAIARDELPEYVPKEALFILRDTRIITLPDRVFHDTNDLAGLLESDNVNLVVIERFETLDDRLKDYENDIEELLEIFKSYKTNGKWLIAPSEKTIGELTKSLSMERQSLASTISQTFHSWLNLQVFDSYWEDFQEAIVRNIFKDLGHNTGNWLARWQSLLMELSGGHPYILSGLLTFVVEEISERRLPSPAQAIKMEASLKEWLEDAFITRIWPRLDRILYKLRKNEPGAFRALIGECTLKRSGRVLEYYGFKQPSKFGDSEVPYLPGSLFKQQLFEHYQRLRLESLPKGGVITFRHHTTKSLNLPEQEWRAFGVIRDAGGRPVELAAIASKLYPDSEPDNSERNTRTRLQKLMSRLKETFGNTLEIKNVHGVGYQLVIADSNS